jgi:hypothetical protein
VCDIVLLTSSESEPPWYLELLTRHGYDSSYMDVEGDCTHASDGIPLHAIDSIDAIDGIAISTKHEMELSLCTPRHAAAEMESTPSS